MTVYLFRALYHIRINSGSITESKSSVNEIIIGNIEHTTGFIVFV
jgi:hypothetical protein